LFEPLQVRLYWREVGREHDRKAVLRAANGDAIDHRLRDAGQQQGELAMTVTLREVPQ
jgi:hypothetical protein